MAKKSMVDLNKDEKAQLAALNPGNWRLIETPERSSC